MGRVMIEEAIASYRAELAADRSLGDDTLDELTEHLRTAVDDRIAAGDDEATAIDAARHRFGEPRALARECARVRSSAGPRTSYARAWGAAALSVLWTWLATRNGLSLTPTFVVCGTVLVGGLVARMPLATAFVFGLVVAMIAGDLSSMLVWDIHGTWRPQGCDIPTTIIETTMLVLLCWGYKPSRAAKVMIGLGIVCMANLMDGEWLWTLGRFPATGSYEHLIYALVPILLAFACIGSVFGTRWGAWLSAVVAAGIGVALVGQIIEWAVFWPAPTVAPVALYAGHAIALAGALSAAVLGSHTSRPLRMGLEDLRAGLA
jgi:hypothetical protein